MKKLFAITAIIAFAFVSNGYAQNSDSKMSDQNSDKMMNQSSDKMMDKKSDKMSDKKELKEHVCTAACKDGKHVYMHGEKGHVCTAECKKMNMKKMESKKAN